ncbi:hypothetical protein pdam_00007738 [Pocillopora damicornis]|uniref:EGF-like domain-containing protein n=1 Tax=Pocillopora damicornis TaxID=46731 RepID=A0A3M6V0A8_POCDA|nr:hypothetical protein pdam_00007738 [Pocillopora damicornis]
MVYANFKAHAFSYLNTTSMDSEHVLNGSECGFACVSNPSCSSFNLAAFHDGSGKLLCEFLPSDVFNNSDKFIISQSYHHFSITIIMIHDTRALCQRLSLFSTLGPIIRVQCPIQVCDVNANCQHTYSSYSCSCKTGFIEDEKIAKVYCDITQIGEGWTLIVRFSNNDVINWMSETGHRWYDQHVGIGATTTFCLVSGRNFKITHSNDPQSHSHGTAWPDKHSDLKLHVMGTVEIVQSLKAL